MFFRFCCADSLLANLGWIADLATVWCFFTGFGLKGFFTFLMSSRCRPFQKNVQWRTLDVRGGFHSPHTCRLLISLEGLVLTAVPQDKRPAVTRCSLVFPPPVHQELQTMCDVDETDTAGTHSHRRHHHHHRSLSNGNNQPSSARPPPPPAGFSPNRHLSPRLSGGGGGGRGVSALSSAAAAVASCSSPAPPARAAPSHHHHLRERGVPRSRHERAEEEEEEEEEMRAAARGGGGGRGRRHRPRSVSMPEGMELQARVRVFFCLAQSVVQPAS